MVFILGNILYWSLPVMMVMGHGIQEPTPERILVSIMVLVFGLSMMLAADAQKYFTL